ncbi:hypothetical protein JKF63_03905 [Porcisia hertigi]|uniref:TLC domain-containing protein n=1 Tax=Porcisia hertigi TaxID=2761500 RepID=A0A836I6J0_9TRYP|nr:hypothetical protein JKF63_03905 [Porcisia hertigi]
MAFQYPAELLRAQGISSPYASALEFYIPDPANTSRLIIDTARTTLQWSELPGALLNIKAYQDKIGVGCSGWGVDVSLFSMLLPSLYWFLGIMVIRHICHDPVARFGIYVGVVTENADCHRRRIAAGKRGIAALSSHNQKKLLKFQNQVWLSLFYVASSCFGYYVQRGEPWFKLPLNTEASLEILLPHPYNPPKEFLLYYNIGLAFYLAELCSLLFIERHVRRSDFLQYLLHHIITILLIVCSHLGMEHRIGAYVLFIHDVSDIMLSVSKSLHYMMHEDAARQMRYNRKHAKLNGKTYRKPLLYRRIITDWSVNGCFALFSVLFFFFRLYCLPHIGRTMIFMASKVRHGNLNMWLLCLLLNVVLQGLHVYWGILIVTMILSLAMGEKRKDIRSEDDDDSVERPSCVNWGLLTESDDDADAHRGDHKPKSSKPSPEKTTRSSSSSSSKPRNGLQARSASKKRQQQRHHQQ